MDQLYTRKTVKEMKVLKNNSGASILFVLAITFLLLAIGVSVLIAAAAGRGAMVRQMKHNQFRLLDNSIHNTIMYSLQQKNDADNSLGAQLVWALYETAIAGDKLGESSTSIDKRGRVLNLDIDLEDFEINDVVGEVKVYLTFLVQDVFISPPQPPIFVRDYDNWNGLGVPEWILAENGSRVPETATVSARMIVTVVIYVDGEEISTESEYVLDGKRVISDDTNPMHECSNVCLIAGCGDDFVMKLVRDNIRWELVRRGEMISNRG